MMAAAGNYGSSGNNSNGRSLTLQQYVTSPPSLPGESYHVHHMQMALNRVQRLQLRGGLCLGLGGIWSRRGLGGIIDLHIYCAGFSAATSPLSADRTLNPATGASAASPELRNAIRQAVLQQQQYQQYNAYSVTPSGPASASRKAEQPPLTPLLLQSSSINGDGNRQSQQLTPGGSGSSGGGDGVVFVTASRGGIVAPWSSSSDQRPSGSDANKVQQANPEVRLPPTRQHPLLVDLGLLRITSETRRCRRTPPS